MALGLKYFARYRDIDGIVKEVRFLKEAYEGPATEWFCMNGAVRYDYAGFDGMFEKPIIPSQARITLFLSQYYDLKDFVFNRKTYFCEIWHVEEGVINWSGWIEPWDARRPHRKPPWTVELTASCGLAHLAKKKYLNQTDQFKKTGLQIIKECLATIGVTQPIRISTHMVETTWGGDDRLGLNSFEIDVARYYDNNGEAMYCDVIVNDILEHFTAELVQEKNRWVIRSTVDNATGLATGYIDIDNPGAPADMPFTYSINGEGDSATMNDGNVRILPPINKYRTEIDFGAQAPFFLNGNMVLWTENGLVGWDFTHMNKSTTDGWERFEIGGEISRGVLKINGKSPQPYRKKKKKKFLQVLIPILTGMVGANLKNKYYDIEPTQYIESPGGIISRGDKSVTISFDYETDALASDILISIRIPIQEFKSKKINDFWVDPSIGVALAGADKSHAGATQEFKLIRIPAVDMGTLTNKGDLDVSGNPNYPAATWTPGSRDINWTWTATGVPPGEYRRVGGINGVLVENGDLIVARVPNNGGSQAEVGGSWEIIGMRNNVKKGTFSITVAINTLIIAKAGDPWPADKIYVRFYKMADDEGLPGDWYKVYNLNGALEGFIAKEESGKYATVLQRGDVTDEEAKTINLISGDYNPWYAGSWTKPGSKENTRTWRRRPDLNEAMSVYRAMMLDRLSLTSRPLTVVEGVIKLAPGAPRLSYLHTLLMQDMGGMRMRLTRFSYNDYNRQVTFTAIEVKYEEIPREELKQDSYIPGSRQLNTIPGEGDGIYPSKQDSTNGRLIAEDMALTDDELAEALEQGSRLAALFEGIPPLIFIAGELSTQSVNLNNFISEVVKYNNQSEDEEDIFDFNSLRWLVIEKPSWIIDQRVVFLNVSATGKPIYVGDYSIVFKVGEQTAKESQEAIDEAIAEAEANGEEYLPAQPFYIDVEIPIKVYPKTIVTYELLDMSGDAPVVIGPLPGVYPVPLGKWDIRVKIKGQHDWWQMSLFGGGATGNNQPMTVNSNVDPTDLGTYIMFQESGGIQTGAGQYRHFTTTQIEKTTVGRQNMVFTLYDDEFLESGRFYLKKGGEILGEISLDGTSIFENPEGCDVVFVTDGVEHDNVSLQLYTKDEVLIKGSAYPQPGTSTVENGEYGVYGADSLNQIGKFIINASVYLDDNEVVGRFTDFELVKKKPEAEGGGLALMQKVPGSLNFKQIAVLPQSGSEHELPDPGFNVKVIGESDPFVSESWIYQVIRGGVLVTVDLSKYTGLPQLATYNNPVTESGLLIFGNKSSLDIDNIHEEDTTHRVIVTRRDAEGTVVAILQADFSFGTFQDPDEVPDEDDTSNLVDYVARDGIFEEVIDYIKYFDVLYDGETIGLNEDNELEIIEDGVLFKHMQPIGPMTVMGNLTAGSINPYAVTVVDLMDEAEIGDLITAIAIKNYVIGQIEDSITGTPGFFPIYDTAHTFADSIVRQVANKVGFGVNPTEVIHVAGNILATGQLKSTIGIGTSPLTVVSTTLVANLNADLLDGQHGPYYLDWNNFTNYKSVIAGNGLIDGGLLDVDVMVSLGTPSTLNASTTNAVSATSHTHAISTGSLIQGANIVLSGTLANRLIGLGDVTIAATAIPWTIVTGKPISLAGFGILDGVTIGDFNIGLGMKENVFSKGDIIQGAGLSITGPTLLNKLVGLDDVTFALAASGVGAGNYKFVTVDVYGRVTAGTNPNTVSGFGLTDVYTVSEVNALLSGKENSLAKGSLIQGQNVSLSGDLVNRLVGSGGNVTVAITSFPWSSISGKPTTIAGYGITDVYTKNQVDIEIAGRAQAEHTHPASDIIQFTSEVRSRFSAGTNITISPTGVISASDGADGVSVGTAAQRRATNGFVGQLWLQTNSISGYTIGLYYCPQPGVVWVRLADDVYDYSFTSGT